MNGISATKRYAIGLILAIFVLLVTATVSYKRIKGLQESSELVNRSRMVDKEINRMFSNYSMLKSTELDYAVNRNEASLFLLKNYREQSEDALQRIKKFTADNPEQQKNLERLTALKTDFLENLETVIKYRKENTEPDETLSDVLEKVTELMEKIRVLKDKMIASEDVYLKERTKEYDALAFFTPLAILGLVLFSIAIFSIAFWKIVKNRGKMVRTRAFLENILQGISNLIAHLRPVRNETGTIVDYKIIFNNEHTTKVTGLNLKEIKGKPISEVFPILMENGVFEMLNKCLNEDKVLDIEREYEFLGKPKVFKSTAIKLNEGVVLTSTDVTAERTAARRLENFNKDLAIKNAAMNEAEVLARVGSFRMDVQNGKAEISDNYYRLLGMEPGDAPFSYELYSSFIHPEDLDQFKKVMAANMNTKNDVKQTYRIITKNGTVKTFEAAGRFFTEKGKNFRVGVVQDITQELQRKRHLEDQNIDLKRSNEELDSFNHVVSHDLQEPLRKIQTFISLISEESQLSAENQYYFEKIDTEASHMQTLIKHLLTYSRIGKSNQVFVDINLNEILEKVRDDQSEIIAETDVKLTFKDMPTLKGIPFQIRQLFNNLVSNALKYGGENRQSKILITSETVHRNQIQDDFRKKFKSYHRLLVIDNGIGFDQVHSEKIFELFQRLHQNKSYSGTGLGLAICKKIIETHDGHISAVSEKGKGTTFTIYLPAQ